MFGSKQLRVIRDEIKILMTSCCWRCNLY